jgi:hypothetical protein
MQLHKLVLLSGLWRRLQLPPERLQGGDCTGIPGFQELQVSHQNLRRSSIVMAVERMLPGGDVLSAPVGAVLLAGGIAAALGGAVL